MFMFLSNDSTPRPRRCFSLFPPGTPPVGPSPSKLPEMRARSVKIFPPWLLTACWTVAPPLPGLHLASTKLKRIDNPFFASKNFSHQVYSPVTTPSSTWIVTFSSAGGPPFFRFTQKPFCLSLGAAVSSLTLQGSFDKESDQVFFQGPSFSPPLPKFRIVLGVFLGPVGVPNSHVIYLFLFFFGPLF